MYEHTSAIKEQHAQVISGEQQSFHSNRLYDTFKHADKNVRHTLSMSEFKFETWSVWFCVVVWFLRCAKTLSTNVTSITQNTDITQQ